jgi:hypothetical protein
MGDFRYAARGLKIRFPLKECGFESHPGYPDKKPQNMPLSAFWGLF